MSNETIDLPLNETRKFKYGILPNKLKYVIIQDENDDMSNVSMSVKVGSLDEPHEYMGLAHFLEHMLFLGSNMYKKESHFDEKLRAFGGSCNAYTGQTETVYYFNVLNTKKNKKQNDYMEEILDIFSRFFIDPLFDINSVEREINAINSEHLKNLNNDIWVNRQILFNLSNKDSGINKFSTGTLETLGSHDIKTLRDKMIEFYNSYYCSDNMCITIQTFADVDITEKLIIKYFSSIEYIKSKPTIVLPDIKYDIKNEEYVMTPVNDMNYIIYFWDVPSFENYLFNKVDNIIDNIIEYNGSTNLKNVLKHMGLATGIMCIYQNEGIFSLQVNLNDMGDIQKHFENINNVVRDYFNIFLQDKKLLKKLYEYEISKMKLNYMYDTKNDNTDLVNMISTNLHYYPIKNVYNGNMLVIKKDLEALYDYVSLLLFKNCNIIYGTKNKIDKDVIFIKDKYYLQKYGKLNKTFITNSTTLSSPHDFSIVLDNKFLNIMPKVINNLDNYQVPTLITDRYWYGGTSQYKEPYVCGLIYLSHRKLVYNVKQFMLTTIACNILNQYVSEIFSQEFELGYTVGFYISPNDGILTIEINGLNYNYNEFFNKVLDKIKKIKPEEIIIQIIISRIKETLRNIINLSPWDYASYILGLKQYNYSYNMKQKIEAVDNIMEGDYYNTILKRIQRITSMDKLSVTTVIYGNISKMDLPEIISTYEPHPIPLPSVPYSLTIKHPNKNECNKVVMMMLPCGKYSELNVAKNIILSMLLDQPTYMYLRTKEQLGYLVNSTLYYDRLNYYIIIKVQSALDIDFVETKMKKYIKWFKKYLETIESSKFIKIKNSAKSKLLKNPNNMTNLMDKYINEIRERTYIFNRTELIADMINKIDIISIIELYENIIKDLIILKIT